MSATSAPTAFIRCKAWRCSPHVGDVLTLEAGRRTCRWRSTGPFAGGLAGEGDNLVLRAARALAAKRAQARKTDPDQESAGGVRHRRRLGRCGGGAARPAPLWELDIGRRALARDRRRAGLRYSGLRRWPRRASWKAAAKSCAPWPSMPRMPHAAGQSRCGGADQGRVRRA